MTTTQTIAESRGETTELYRPYPHEWEPGGGNVPFVLVSESAESEKQYGLRDVGADGDCEHDQPL